MRKTNQKEFRVEKVIKKKGEIRYVKWKGFDNSFNSWIDKKRYCYIKGVFSEPHTHSKNKIEVELDLANYATKSDLKNATNVETSIFSNKADLACLK